MRRSAIVVTLAAAQLLVWFAGGASAGEPVWTDSSSPAVLTRAVSLADLDLGTPAGIATLYGRIRAAASYVCRPFASPVNRERVARCYERSIADGIARVGSPALRDLDAKRKAG